MIIWKIRITIRKITRSIIQSFDHIYYNSKRESIEEEQERAR